MMRCFSLGGLLTGFRTTSCAFLHWRCSHVVDGDWCLEACRNEARRPVRDCQNNSTLHAREPPVAPLIHLPSTPYSGNSAQSKTSSPEQFFHLHSLPLRRDPSLPLLFHHFVSFILLDILVRFTRSICSSLARASS